MKNQKIAFADLQISEGLIKSLLDQNISHLTDIQATTIPQILERKDVIAVAQTGSGKTLGYLIPMVQNLLTIPTSRLLVLTPTRETAQQVYNVIEGLLKDSPLTKVLAIGGTPGDKQANQLNRLPRIIVATPGRLNDHLLKNKLLLQGLDHIVLDEADRMLDMGFLPQLQSIHRTLRGSRQNALFTATLNAAVETVAKIFIEKKQPEVIRTEHSEKPVEQLEQQIIYLMKGEKNDRILDVLNQVKGSTIVFTADKESCEKLFFYLKEFGYKIDFIHGELSTGNRNRVIREFREGQLRVLVATDLLARGLDVPEVECVINFEFPFQPEDFLHRIGRTARAGKQGVAITFVTEYEQKKLEKVKKYLEGATEIGVPHFKKPSQSKFKKKFKK